MEKTIVWLSIFEISRSCELCRSQPHPKSDTFVFHAIFLDRNLFSSQTRPTRGDVIMLSSLICTRCGVLPLERLNYVFCVPPVMSKCKKKSRIKIRKIVWKEEHHIKRRIEKLHLTDHDCFLCFCLFPCPVPCLVISYKRTQLEACEVACFSRGRSARGCRICGTIGNPDS